MITYLLIACLSMAFAKGYAQKSSPYVVLTTVNSSDPYYAAAQALSTYRSAPIVHFSPDSITDLIPILTSLAPRYVAVVIKPIQLDINFVRKFLVMSTNIDSDPFSDFSYGYITGATATDALNFVNNTIYAETHAIQGYPLNVGGYSASSLNFVYPGSGDFMKYLNPPISNNIYMETNDLGTGHNFFLANTSYMLNNKLLNIGHNGDAHMLWLFENGNSTTNPPPWIFDSTKIEDTAYARVGLTSFDIGALNLYPAVAFNGACHAGEPKRVMIESDIEATFGDTQGLIKFYTMSDTFSFCLSILKTGITGYFAPCGANNANDQGEEIYNAFLYDEPLGDVQKRTIDGVVMGCLGNRPNLKIFQSGGSIYDDDILSSGTFNPADWSGAAGMLGGKANRIYYGDPLYNPYKFDHSDSLKITKTSIDSITYNTFDIPLTFKKPDASVAYFPIWDKFHFGNSRIYTSVELPTFCGAITKFEVVDSSGPYHMVIHAVEQFEGKNILHIEVDIPDDMYAAINYNIRFRITFIPTGIATVAPALISEFDAYPNPTEGQTIVKLGLNSKSDIRLNLYDITGRLVKSIFNGIMEKGTHKINLLSENELVDGIYFIRLESGDTKSTKKLVIVK
ncbi:MAG: T9SS type A sorting domain-containing protein [Bacteroidota bacterium]